MKIDDSEEQDVQAILAGEEEAEIDFEGITRAIDAVEELTTFCNPDEEVLVKRLVRLNRCLVAAIQADSKAAK